MSRPWLKSYEPGVPAEITYPDGMLVQHILETSAARFPNRPAVILPIRLGKNLFEGRVSYRDLERSANRFANGMASLGIQKGGRIGLLLPNSPQFLISFFGSIKAGAVVVAFDPFSNPQELERQLIDCGAETVVTMTRFYPTVKQVQANTLVTRVITTNIREYFPPIARAISALVQESQEDLKAGVDRRDYSFKRLIRGSSEVAPRVELVPEDIALLQYASASGDSPKGAILTHRNLIANCLQSANWRVDTEPGREVVLCASAFSSPYGMQFCMLANIFLGGALILSPAFETRDVSIAINRYQPTLLAGDTTLYREFFKYPAIGKHDLRSIRLFLSCPAPIPGEVQESWENLTGLSLVGVYSPPGSGTVTHACPIHVKCASDQIGLPLPGILSRIVNAESVSVELPAGQVGKLAVKGEQVFGGYWNRPGETAQALQDGWLIAADSAWMDENGFFHVVPKELRT
jgi:long-chain acyl-CoA synthetase